MQFKNPEILYLLFLLIIPILIHLFQLQKFQKIAFTNVKLLKEIEQQTRKSSQLKKLLILLSRLFLFACLIFAFAQPFFSKEKSPINKDTFIYVDNSLSMQAKGENGELLQKVKTDLIKNLSNKKSDFTLITNNQTFNNVNITDIKNNIINMDYYPIKKELNTLLLQIQSLQNKKIKNHRNVLLISDFQNINIPKNTSNFDSLTTYSLIQTLPNNFKNIALDSVWIKDQNKDNIQIKAIIKSYQLAIENLSISLFINNKLFGKTTVNLDKDSQAEIDFSIPNTKNSQGKLSLNDNKLMFDNTLYFNIADKEKTPVLVIGENSDFLSRIYTDDDFYYLETSLDNLDYGSIIKQDLIILNELNSIPNSLSITLKNYASNGGNMVVIPSLKSDITTYNKLFTDLNLGKINSFNKTTKAITTINYNHPFFKNVFQKQITNFQYPSVKTYFETDFKSATSLLQFEDKSDFISEIKLKNSRLYWISSPLNSNNSNFISSPLIVPVFYNFSIKNTTQKQLFYTVGLKNEILVKSNNQNDDAVHLVKNDIDFIPLQSKTANHLTIETDNYPLKDGLYQLKRKEKVIQHIAYNYNREEGNLAYYPIDKFVKSYNNIQYFTSLNEALKQLNDQNKNKNLWQLFIIFALLFLGLEIILQKFFKS